MCVYIVIHKLELLLCVFTFLVPCCDRRYDFHIKAVFDSYL
jgi:hypothetical protein